MAVTHIIPKVNTSKASEIRDHQGPDTRVSPVNLVKLIDSINSWKRYKIAIFYSYITIVSHNYYEKNLPT